MPAAVSSEDSRFVLRDAADIKRLFFHLVTHWTLPRVEFHIDGLPSVASQRAQDRFVRLHEGCNCLIGEMLGGVTLLVGSFIVWKSIHGWHGLGWVVLAAVYAALIGKGIELLLVRARLLLVLRGLRRRLAAGPELEEAPRVVSHAAAQLRPLLLNRDDDDAVLNGPIQRPVQRSVPKRPRFLVCNATDINSLIPRLATQWTLPRIEIRTDALAPVDVQLAQVRTTRFSGNCSYLPAAVLATLVLLGGLLYAVWSESDYWMNMQSQEWRDAQMDAWWLSRVKWTGPVFAALCAGAAGSAIEWIWMRLRLLLVLRGLRRRLV